MPLPEGYHHPPTFASTGDHIVDFSHSLAAYEDNVRHLLPRAKDCRILDIGCGWGQFLSWVRQRGYTDAVGIDIGQEQVEFCRSRGLDAILVVDAARYLQNNPSHYDLIALNHVLEHMPTAAGFDLLSEARRALKPGGRIVVQTPNMSAVSASYTRYIEVSHQAGFTEISLAEILQLTGFHQVSVFGSRARFTLNPRRIALLALRLVTRTIWRAMLLAELGTDTPLIVAKNLFGTGTRPVDGISTASASRDPIVGR